MAKNFLPYCVSWLITNRCNMACQHCYPSSGKEVCLELTPHEAKRALKNVLSIRPKIIFFSGGEPFLREDLFKLCQVTKDSGVKILICTNGSLLNKERIKKIREIGIEGIIVSLDSPNEEENDKFRGFKGAYKRAMRTIALCKAWGVDVSLETTVMRLNFNKIEEVVDLAERLGVKRITFKRFRPIGRGRKHKGRLLLTPRENFATLKIIYQKSKELGNKLEIKVHDPLYSLILANKEDIAAGFPMGCMAGVFWAGITPNGDILPCPLLNIKIGNIKDESLKKVWEKSVVIRKLQERRKNCRFCRYIEVCGGCRAHTFGERDNYLAKDPMCLYGESCSS